MFQFLQKCSQVGVSSETLMQVFKLYILIFTISNQFCIICYYLLLLGYTSIHISINSIGFLSVIVRSHVHLFSVAGVCKAKLHLIANHRAWSVITLYSSVQATDITHV